MLPPPGHPKRDRPPIPGDSVPAVRPPKPAGGLTKPRRPRAQGLTPIERKVTQHEEAAFAVIETEMGGRAKLISTLSTVQLPANVEKVLALLADPINDAISLARVCALAEVSQRRLMEVFKAATLARGQMIAVARIAEKIPDVAASVMDDSVAGWRQCINCEGARVVVVMERQMPTEADPNPLPIEVTKPCGPCQGRGLVYFQPEHDVQKTALTIGGLLDKGGMKVTTIVNNQNNNAGTDSGSYDTLIKHLDAAIYGEGRARTRQADLQSADRQSAAPDDEDPPIIEGEVANDTR